MAPRLCPRCRNSRPTLDTPSTPSIPNTLDLLWASPIVPPNTAARHSRPHFSEQLNTPRTLDFHTVVVDTQRCAFRDVVSYPRGPMHHPAAFNPSHSLTRVALPTCTLFTSPHRRQHRQQSQHHTQLLSRSQHTRLPLILAPPRLALLSSRVL